MKKKQYSKILKRTLLFSLVVITSVTAQKGCPEDTTITDHLTITQIRESKLEGVCYQSVQRGSNVNNKKNSTSFFIDKNFLLTSAHNVVRLLFRNAKKITIYPSRIGNEKHLDSIELLVNYKKQIRYPSKYCFLLDALKIRSMKRCDYALVYVPDALIDANPKLKNIPYIKLIESDYKLKKEESLYCPGYPAACHYANKYLMTCLLYTSPSPRD